MVGADAPAEPTVNDSTPDLGWESSEITRQPST